MHNLNDWVKAQLKRGYSLDQIKKVLNGRGYPLKVVAEADKLDVRKEKKPNMAVVALLLVIIVISSVFVFKLFNQQDPVQQILQDEKIIDPQQAYKGFNTSLLFAHRISGGVVGINQSMIRLRVVNGSIITIPHTYPTANFFVLYFQVANGTRTITSRQAISVGDRISLIRYNDAVTYKNIGMAITIKGQTRK